MRPVLAFRRHFALLALSGATALSAAALELTPNSPFMPPAGSVDNTPVSTGAPIELHGIMAISDNYKFDLYDPSNHKDIWVGPNETGKPYVVQSQDVVHNRVTVQYQGHEFTLTLPQPKITPGSAPPLLNQRPVIVIGPQPVATTPTADDERRRMERVTEEIKRRRALRTNQQKQLMPQPQSTGTPPPAPSVPRH